MDKENILIRLERLESIEAIRTLVSNYAESCDQQDLKALEKLFTVEAEFNSPNGSLQSKGRQNILDMYQEVFMTRGPSFHWTHDTTVTIDEENSDLASGTVYSHAETTRDGIASLAAMRYDDEYSKEEESWKFSKRVIHFFYYVKTEDYLSSLNSPLRVTMGDKKIAADIPESIPAWIEFQEKYKK
jgi:ketosteroid isomerase-like protein|tara:strand:- start:126 stop:683 length:558 start_codon:yes stop_codon:yes gene_type:complete